MTTDRIYKDAMLIDTSGFYCFFDENDRRHADARALLQAADARLTTSYVLAELIPLCYARRLNQQKTLAFVATAACTQTDADLA